jgi:hypothetical protein
MKRFILAAAAAASLLGAGLTSAGGAVAQGGPGQGNPARAAVRQACAADVQKLCPDKTGPDRRQCMMDHAADLSDGCKSAMAAMREQRQAQKPSQ